MNWVRGRALQTVIALGELKGGDEVLVKACNPKCKKDYMRCHVHHAGMITPQVWKRSPPLVVEHMPGYSTELIARRPDGNGVFITLENIAAWRRPKK